jgi:predicted dehydrogenase
VTDAPRVALVGAGLAVRPWLDALADLGVEVASVATRDADRFARVQERFPAAVRCWPPATALELPGLDACVNLSPPYAHLDGVRLAADRGLPVLVEKPLETTLERAVEAVAVAERAGIGLGVCFQYRYREGARALAELVDSGELGRLRALTVDVPWHRSADYYREPGRGTYARDGGGVLMTQAIHALDLAMSLCGPPEWVWADLRRASFHELEAEDLACAVIGAADGVVCSVFATTGAHLADRTTIRVLGTKGTAVLEDNHVTVYREGVALRTAGEHHRPASEAPGPMAFSSRWHRDLLRDTLAAFAAGTEPPVSGRAALTVQALVAAMEESSRRRAQIPFVDPAQRS